MSRRAYSMIGVFVGLAGIVIAICAGGEVIALSVLALLTGWCAFLVDAVSTVQWNVSGIATAIAALVVFAIGLHRLAGWFYLENGCGGNGDPTTWKFRWTTSLAALIVLMFCAGIAIVGIAHQVVWIATSPESMTEIGRTASRRTQSKSNLRQIGLALHTYHDVNHAFPAGGTFDRFGEPQHGWQSRLLPFVDQLPLYSSIAFDLPWDDPRNSEAIAHVISLYLNPGVNSSQVHDRHGRALTHYSANGHVMNGRDSKGIQDITDGTSNTILAGEIVENLGPWGSPLNWRDPALGINKSSDSFGGPWKGGGANFLMSDISVRFIGPNIHPTVLKALSTPAGGEPVGDF